MCCQEMKRVTIGASSQKNKARACHQRTLALLRSCSEFLRRCSTADFSSRSSVRFLFSASFSSRSLSLAALCISYCLVLSTLCLHACIIMRHLVSSCMIIPVVSASHWVSAWPEPRAMYAVPGGQHEANLTQQPSCSLWNTTHQAHVTAYQTTMELTPAQHQKPYGHQLSVTTDY
jgi:hypothetical protein